MIKLMFEKQKQFFIITIDNKKVLYWDKLMGGVWGGPLQYLPPDPAAIIKINNSRNRIPAHMKDMLKVSDAEKKEFNDAKNDTELKSLVIRDCKIHGCNLVNEETK